MINSALLKHILNFIPIVLALFTALVFGRICEWGLLWYHHSTEIFDLPYLVMGIISDIQFSLVAAILLMLFFAGVRKVLPSKQYIITTILIMGFGLSNLLLITYFGATLVPLGPEFWIYTLQEMIDTVIAAEGLTPEGILMFLAIAGILYYSIHKMLSKPLFSSKQRAWILSGFCLSMVIGIPLNFSIETPTNYRSNKLAYFISSGIKAGNWFAGRPGEFDFKEEYPFLRTAADENVLGPYFRDLEEQPDIVFLLVESLGGEFTGSGKWSGFAPFIDSLAQEGLYWENGLSLSGRTFGMMPSLLGSLPHGRNGFMNAGPDYPDHFTLISLLKEQGYRTSFYSGYDTYFDKLDYFLNYQGMDFILNKQKIQSQLGSGEKEKNENYWGFDDRTMLDIASSIEDTAKAFPRLGIYHTLQSHSPFTVPQPEKYANKFDNLVKQIDAPEAQKEDFRRYRSELTTLLFTDDAIKEFMANYRTRERFDNTIFIITGDHWLIPVPQTSSISRYHVPIIIYSPLLKAPVQFQSVNTHANIIPGLISLLKHNAGLETPDNVHWIGSPPDTSRSFQNIHSLPLMKNKNQLTDFIDGSYYLSDNKLYELRENLRLITVNEENKRVRILEKLNQFKSKNEYVFDNNKIYPRSGGSNMSQKYRYIVEYDTLFNRIDSAGMSLDEQFELARQLAFEEQYEASRAVAVRILSRDADYLDVKLLVGRTHAWDGSYDKARKIYKEILEQHPEYDDSYNALYDTEYWDGNYETALEVINNGLEHHPNHEQFLEKKIQVLAELNRYSKIEQVYFRLKENHPRNKKLPELKTYISQ